MITNNKSTFCHLLICLLVISSCTNKNMFGIAVSNGKSQVLYYTEMTEGLQDSSVFEKGYWSMPPRDLTFINENTLAYHGKFVVKHSDSNTFKKYSIGKTEPEQFFSQAISKEKVVLLIDSVDIAYVIGDRFTLEGYSLDLKDKLFSIYLEDDSFELVEYTKKSIPTYYFVNDYLGWVNKKGKKVFRVLNGKNESIDTLETFYLKNDLMFSSLEDNMYVDIDIRRIRIINDYLFNYMKINRKLGSDENWFEIIEYDCGKQNKKVLFKATLPKLANIYRYRIIKGQLFVSAGNKIYSLSRDGTWKIYYTTPSENEIILDFVPK